MRRREMRTAGHIALAAVIATIPACSEGGAPCEAEFGPWGEMPDVDMLVGDTVETSLKDYFSPVGCFKFYANDDRVWVIRSADPAAVAVSVSGGVLTIAALDVADSARVEVGTDLLDGESRPPHEFYVRVRPRPTGR